jgi:hypothetical protein
MEVTYFRFGLILALLSCHRGNMTEGVKHGQNVGIFRLVMIEI